MPLRGIWEFRGHNLFAATFRAVYACFLFTTALILQFYAPMITDAAGATNFGHMFDAYLIVWALFTAMLALARSATSPFPRSPRSCCPSWSTSCWGSATSRIGGRRECLHEGGGWFGLVGSLAALYLCAAIVLNDVSGRTLLPIWSASRGTRLISGRTVC